MTATAVRQLDLRPLPPHVRHGIVFQCFDGLAVGEALVLVNDHDPMPLVQQFRFVRPGESEHEYVERGPTAWQVRITRKAPGRAVSPAAPAQDGSGDRAAAAGATVSEYLESDHRRLDAILPRVRELAAAGAYQDAATRFEEFVSGLDRHIEAEEQILFPTFEEATGMVAGPTSVMRSEHVEIRRWMETGAASLAGADRGGFEQAAGALSSVLAVHNMKEERMLYPMVDRAVGGGPQLRQLVARLQAF